MTPYAKTPQTNEDIAAILESRGLAFDKDQLLAFLAKVGYYRLKGYLVPFRQPDRVDFAEGADFATVKAIYDFDDNLRTVSGKGACHCRGRGAGGHHPLPLGLEARSVSL